MTLWTPDQITTIAWWDASDASTITDIAGAVSQLDDKGTTSLNHLTQGTAANQFTTGIRTLNGLNVFDSDGNDYMFATSATPQVSGDLQIAGVNQIDSNTAIGSSLWSWNAPSRDFQYQADGSSNFNGAISTNGIGASLGGDGPVNGPSVYGNIFDFNGAAQFNAFVDGTANSNGPNTYTNALNTGGTFGVFINRNISQHINGAFSEMVIAEDVTVFTRQLLEGYLAHKWGLEANLPPGHPYEFEPPMIADDVDLGGISSRIVDSVYPEAIFPARIF